MGKVELALVIGLAACTSSSTVDDAGTDARDGLDAGRDAGSDTSRDVRPPDTMPIDTNIDGIPDIPGLDTSAVCVHEASFLRLQRPPAVCSVIARIRHDTFQTIARQTICGPRMDVDEAAARAMAMSDTGFGGDALNPDDPEDAFVFFEAPGDLGSVAVVNARNGLTNFGASIVWDGAGDIAYPDDWDGLHRYCSHFPIEIAAHGYDLVDGGELDEEEIEAVVDTLRWTAVPLGFDWSSSMIFDALILRYPRSVGGFDSTTAEWIAIVTGG